jgi:hypothetical protein
MPDDEQCYASLGKEVYLKTGQKNFGLDFSNKSWRILIDPQNA